MPERIKCLVIEDEPPARELLCAYISRLDSLELYRQFSNALDAFSFLQKNEVQLLFLDIQMHGMTGLELIRGLHNKPAIILTTAFREYAVDGFELNVLDYLVKPISFDRFLKAVSKYHHYASKPSPADAQSTVDVFEHAYMFFKVNKEMVKIFLKNIIYIESIGDYVKIITETASYITYQRINFMEEKLPEKRFQRIHKSYIIALDKIDTFGANSVKIATTELPVGRHYRQKFTEAIEKVTGSGSGKTRQDEN